VSVGLKVDTRATLCEPVEVEVNGVILRVRTVTLKTLTEVQRVYADMRAGSAEAITAGLGSLFEGDVAVLDDLPMDKLVEVIEFAVQSATSKPKDAGKNSAGPENKS
jgi:hypothetical protein